MARHTFARACLGAAVLCLVLVSAMAAMKPEKPKKGPDEVFPAVGAAAQASLCNAEDCVEVWVFFAGPFFETLEVRGPLAAPVFLQGSQPVEFFPEQVRLLILATEDSRSHFTSGLLYDPSKRVPAFISPRLVQRLTTDVPLTHDTLENLRFKAEWKDDGELRAVDGLTWENGYKVWRELTAAEWYYTLTFTACDVPLSDHLLITFFDDGGRKIASLEATVPLGALPYVNLNKKPE